MKKLLCAALIITLGLYSSDSSAQIFRLTAADSGNTIVNTLIATELKKVENTINEGLPGAQPTRLMEGMANSSVMAGKGIGSDYASNMDVFLIGAGVGLGADLEKDPNTDSDISGVGIAPGIIIGANLGFLDTAKIFGMDTNKLNMYLNFMSYGHKQDLGDKEKNSNAEIKMTSLGVHFRYDWIKSRGNKLLGWGGVKFHFGYEYNKTDLTFNTTINETINTTAGTEVITGNIMGSPSATILINTHSIPLELSTDVQLLYFLSLYGGVGADYNMGQAKGNGGLPANNSTINCTGIACGNSPGTNVTVTPEANIDANGVVNPFTFRGFAGVQFNLPFLRIFVQANKALGNDLIGATAGLRLVY